MADVAIDKSTLGSTYGSGNSTTVVLTTSQAVSSGARVVLGIGWYGDTTVTVTGVSGGSLSWAVDKQASVHDPSPLSVVIASAAAPSGLSSSTAITVTMSGSVPARFVMGLSLLNVNTGTPIDGTALGPTDVSATAAWSTGNYTIAAGSGIVAACYQSGSSSANTITSPSVESTENDNAGDTVSFVLAYRFESGAGSYPIAGSWSPTPGVDGTTNIAVAYKATAGGATAVVAPSTLTMLGVQ